MNFDHELVEHKPVITYNTDGGRFYEIESGERFPSVTTILGSESNDGIQRWVERVGEEEANRVKKKAADRGTKLHKLCEDYINNDVSIDNVCEIFGCKRSSLQRWIIRYQETGQVKRRTL